MKIICIFAAKYMVLETAVFLFLPPTAKKKLHYLNIINKRIKGNANAERRNLHDTRSIRTTLQKKESLADSSISVSKMNYLIADIR